MTPTKNGKVSKADMAVQMIKVLYVIEADINDKLPEEKYQIRQEKSLPQLKKIRVWLDKALLQTLPKGKRWRTCTKTGISLPAIRKRAGSVSTTTR